MDRPPTKRKTLAFGALIGALAITGCKGSDTEDVITDPSVRPPIQTTADSAAFLARRGSRTDRATLQSHSGPGVPIHAGESAVMRIISAECASVGSVLTVSGALSGTISINACFDVGASLAVGPAAADGFLFFTHDDPRFGPGTFNFTGSHPSFTVFMEDGFGDGDFNDSVLSVELRAGEEACEFFEGAVSDPLLQDPEVQKILQDLAELSKFGEPLANREERGGYIVERNGRIEFVEHRYLEEPNLCALVSDPAVVRELLREEGTEILGQVHVHPVHSGSFRNPGNCFKFVLVDGKVVKTKVPGDRIEFKPGPSDPDLDDWTSGVAPFPGYILDPDRIYRFERESPLGPGTPRLDDFKLERGDNRCIRAI